MLPYHTVERGCTCQVNHSKVKTTYGPSLHVKTCPNPHDLTCASCRSPILAGACFSIAGSAPQARSLENACLFEANLAGRLLESLERQGLMMQLECGCDLVCLYSSVTIQDPVSHEEQEDEAKKGRHSENANEDGMTSLGEAHRGEKKEAAVPRPCRSAGRLGQP